MKRLVYLLTIFTAGWGISGCASRPESALSTESLSARETAVHRVERLSPELTAKVLGLDSNRVTDRDVQEVLLQLPAPRIISIHGGILRIQSSMNSFADFLIGMGYPVASLQHPGNGKFAYGHYDESEEIAGIIAWYYEQDGLRPMIIGHSLGGIQTVRILYQLAGDPLEQVSVWNPELGRSEERFEIVDPLTGMGRPVVGLRLPYASAALSGGIARIVPGEWDMNDKLREIPDSVEDFTGFQKGLDMAGGDFMGYGDGNEYHPISDAQIRNVRLPSFSAHWTLTYVKDLLEEPDMLDWINHYKPDGSGDQNLVAAPEFGLQTGKVIWAADVWYSIKKHWVLELQRLIRAKSKPTS